ncbi:uncharacterized protein RJT21DRAFT_133689 [Scheffersomyces amazonensis]|uniref:uncharacterized protein n=1 Tax=Scheffersomyces amazonensis TaxID=1078765 RepID=UPI00315D99D1
MSSGESNQDIGDLFKDAFLYWTRKPIDPFKYKKNQRVEELMKMFEVYNTYTVNSEEVPTDTWLLELILRSDLKLSQIQIKTILGIDSTNETHNLVFELLQSSIAAVVKSLVTTVGSTNLSEYPLTEIKYIIYKIAVNFQPLFFVPVKDKFPIYGSTVRLAPIYTFTNSNPSYLEVVNTINTDTITAGVNKPQCEIIRYHDRFNQMWLLFIMFKSEMEKLKVNEMNPRRYQVFAASRSCT